MKLLIINIFGCCEKRKSEMTSYLNNGYDIMNDFAKFEKFLPHRISSQLLKILTSSQMPELDRGAFPYPL